MADLNTVNCSDCGTLLPSIEKSPRLPCPNCGSKVRTFGAGISVSVRAMTGLGLKAWKNGATRKKWHLSSFAGWSLHRLTGALNYVRQSVDREHNRYFKHVEDENGIVLRHCDEPLDEHVALADKHRMKQNS